MLFRLCQYFSASLLLLLPLSVLSNCEHILEMEDRNTEDPMNAMAQSKQGRLQESNPMMVLKTLKQFLELKKMSKSTKKSFYKDEKFVGWQVRYIVV